MFRHRGKHRTYQHNVRLASLLSFVAGNVNVIGFFAVGQLTTNVTGHFAYFADNIVRRQYHYALVYLLYIISFLSGAFFSNLTFEAISRKNERYGNVVPVSVEIIILFICSMLSVNALKEHPELIAAILLFAMGLQNALVTKISDSVVRTTHLTGLFTDLGIELSQLFFYKEHDQQRRLTASIRLRLVIVTFFLSGCLVGGVGYLQWGVSMLLLAVACLTVGLMYDSVKYRIVSVARRHKE